MEHRLKAAWELTQNPMHMYLMGELAAALIVANRALTAVASGERKANAIKISADALKAIEELGGPDGRLDIERLENLAADYYHARNSAPMRNETDHVAGEGAPVPRG